jgi:hypothetical protein
MFKTSRIFASAFAFGLVGCAASGTSPQDMSATQHEAMAKQEDTAAQAHQAQIDPNASVATAHCPRGQSNPCWTTNSNPTQQHSSDAESHRDMAAKHRAAAGALAQAESRSCGGIDAQDRDESPFFHREDISSVVPLERSVKNGKQTSTIGAGATVTFRAVPGLTAEWLQHEMNCHLARAASVGFNMPEMSYCPLMLKGTTATVSSAGDSFSVAVASDNVDSAKEILSRSQALVAAK